MRELENMIQQVVVLAEPEQAIEPEDLEVTDAVDRAGMVTDEEARQIREPIQHYLDGGSTTDAG